MSKYHFFLIWLEATAAASGGPGLFVLGFLDATFFPFPSINDLLLINLSIRFPEHMVYYSFMSTVGSVVGCLLLFYIGRKGEEAAFHQKAGQHAPKIKHWLERNGFVAMFAVAVLPPPVPLKVFVLAAGALGMPARSFLLAMVLARGLRFYGESYLAVRYGSQATSFLGSHKLAFGVGSAILVAGSYLLYRLVLGRREHAT